MKKFLIEFTLKKCAKLQKEFKFLWWDDKPEGMGTAEARWSNQHKFDKLAVKLGAYASRLEKLGHIEKGDLISPEALSYPSNTYENFRLMQTRIGVLGWNDSMIELDEKKRSPGYFERMDLIPEDGSVN